MAQATGAQFNPLMYSCPAVDIPLQQCYRVLGGGAKGIAPDDVFRGVVSFTQAGPSERIGSMCGVRRGLPSQSPLIIRSRTVV